MNLLVETAISRDLLSKLVGAIFCLGACCSALAVNPPSNFSMEGTALPYRLHKTIGGRERSPVKPESST